ncbi:hypothetical protein GH714_041233 [Hevea brasiliensis]|uniref:FAD-binding PCMH-type domain-containing protein n=1 Tax=Hevea brasiliensis TaxID=3981 RepID=A0A6A6N0F4_HEVBR|nr:hypothetical protein GH714_041233 [Hevea brasiliensis]
MAKATTLLAILLVLVFNLSCFSSLTLAARDDSVYESFLQCLKSKTNPQDQISDIVYPQTNLSYTSVLRAYIRNARLNTSTTPKPLIIITPKQISHVQAAVICTKRVDYQLKIRSGGHDYEGISYISNVPFFVLDMFNLRSMEVDVKNETAWVQSGATLGELYYKIRKKSKVHGFPAGYGLAVDNVLDVQMVDANGKLLDRKTMGEGLFWAIRGGGGGSFGVIISYKIRLVSVPETVTVFRVERTLEENATDFVFKWQLVAPKTDNGLFMRMLLQPSTSKTNKTQKTIRASIVALYLGNADTLVSLLAKEFPEMELKKDNCNETSWIQSVIWWANYDIGTSPEVLLDRDIDSAKFLKRKSDYVQTPIPKDKLNGIWQLMIELGKTGLVFNPYGGRMSEIPATKTPFPHRAGNLFKIQYSVTWDEAGSTAENEYLSQPRKLYRYMTPFVSKNPRGAFFPYRDLDIGVMKAGKNSYEEGSVYGQKYFNGNFDRLVKVKTAVDPDNFFRNEQSIPTLPTKA